MPLPKIDSRGSASISVLSNDKLVRRTSTATTTFGNSKAYDGTLGAADQTIEFTSATDGKTVTAGGAISFIPKAIRIARNSGAIGTSAAPVVADAETLLIASAAADAHFDGAFKKVIVTSPFGDLSFGGQQNKGIRELFVINGSGEVNINNPFIDQIRITNGSALKVTGDNQSGSGTTNDLPSVYISKGSQLDSADNLEDVVNHGTLRTDATNLNDIVLHEGSVTVLRAQCQINSLEMYGGRLVIEGGGLTQFGSAKIYGGTVQTGSVSRITGVFVVHGEMQLISSNRIAPTIT